jgi:hypothetical protein
MLRYAIAAVALAVSGACGGSPSQPTTPPAASPTPAADLMARLTVQVDSSSVRDAIAGFSEVTVDASASTGPGPLTFSVDFGDGTRLTTATGKHVYSNSGAFTVSVEVRDSQGRVASRTQSMTVKRLAGGFFHAVYNPTTRRAEIRRIQIQSHEGPVLRGTYQRSGVADVPFTGTLSVPRRLQIVAGTVALDVVVPNQLNVDGELWRFDLRGDGYDGMLDFRAVVSEPAGPPPDAVLQVRMGSLGSNVGIAGLTNIDFDGAGSRGDGLSYIIEFGDGQFAATARAFHRVEQAASTWPGYAGLLTVVDRFGRANSESIPYAIFTLPSGPEKWYFSGPTDWLSFTFESHAGTAYEGTIRYRYPDGVYRSAPCKATLSGERDVVIVVESLGLEFTGAIDMSTSVYNPGGYSSASPPLTLIQRGGPHDGRAWKLRFDDGPG